MTDEAINAVRAYIQEHLDVLALFLHKDIDTFNSSDDPHEKAYKTQAISGYKEYQSVCSKLTGPYQGRKNAIRAIINELVLSKYCQTIGNDKFSAMLNDTKALHSYGSYIVTLLNLPEKDGKVLTTHGCKSVIGLASAVLDPIDTYLKTP